MLRNWNRTFIEEIIFTVDFSFKAYFFLRFLNIDKNMHLRQRKIWVCSAGGYKLEEEIMSHETTNFRGS